MTVNRLGVVNDTTNGSWAQDNALFLKIFAGEVLTAFNEKNVMRGRHMERTITSGKSASFPATWKTGAGYHTPGSQLTGSQKVKHNERIINVDDFLVSDIFVAKIDELKNHYDVRSEYTKQMGAALARAFDKKTQQVALLAARAAATIDDGYGGSVVVSANARTDANALAGALKDAAQIFDEKDVDEEATCIIKPAQFWLLTEHDKLLSKDFSLGNGDYAKGIVQTAANIALVKSNNLPQGVVAAESGENNVYNGDFTNTVASVFTRSAIGTVKMADLSVSKTADEGDFKTMYLGTLLVAMYLMGHGILRPECAVEIAVA